MSSDRNDQMTLLWVILTSLGVLALTVMAGIFLFYPGGEGTEAAARPPVAENASQETDPLFDPVDWAREDEEFPPLVEETPEEGIVVEMVPAEEITVPETAPAVVAEDPAPAAEPVLVSRQKTVWWIQVGAFASAAKADDVRRDLEGRGIGSTVSTRELEGTLYYRVRLGAFTTEQEAEAFLTRVARIPGYDSSKIFESYITEKVPAGG